MIKRINSLGRKRIARNCVAIAVQDGEPRRFSASIELPDQKWPDDANVVIEAMCAGSSVVKRFGCGTVASLQPPHDLELDGLTGRNVFFVLKVIDHSQNVGRILGIAENLRPVKTGKQTEAGRRGILPVERKPLGQLLWQIEYADQDVVLAVNSDVDGLADRLHSDPLAYSLVYPEVVRQVLSRAIDENIDLEESSDRWPYLWLSFGKRLHPEHSEPPSESDADEDKEEWVRSVVGEFCRKHRLRDDYTTAAIRLDATE